MNQQTSAEAMRQADADARIEGRPTAKSDILADLVAGKISGDEADRRILSKYIERNLGI